MIKDFRGSFSFSFTPDFEYVDFGSLRLDLAYLATANNPSKANLRCFFYKDSIISHDFAAFNISSLSYITANFKEFNLKGPIILGKTRYSFKCSGAKTPSTVP